MYSFTIQKWACGGIFLRGERGVHRCFYKAFFFILKSTSVIGQKEEELISCTRTLQNTGRTGSAVRLKQQQQNLLHLQNQKVG